MRIVLTLFLFCVCMSIKAQQQDMTEMKKAIDLMQGMYDITFVYDSSLVTAKPQAFPSAGNSLKENLERIFGGTGIKWEIRDEYVLLFHPNNYTFSGYVCEDSGETLINVTVLDLNTLKGTLSNEHGFFSITLPEGKHKFRFSYIGYQDVVKEVDLSSNYNGVIYLKESSTALKEVVVVADMNAPLRTTQTGKVSLTSEQLNTEFSLLSSPDLVKTLQTFPVWLPERSYFPVCMYTGARTMRTFFCWTEHRFTRSTIWAGCFPLSIRILSKTWISIKAVSRHVTAADFLP